MMYEINVKLGVLFHTPSYDVNLFGNLFIIELISSKDVFVYTEEKLFPNPECFNIPSKVVVVVPLGCLLDFLIVNIQT